jgi:hypothetical protein
MSKQSRRFDRRDRQRNPLLTDASITLSVVTAPGDYAAGDLLRTDLEMVRSSVLYADRVELHSVGATLMRSAEEVRKGGFSATVEVMTALSPKLQNRFGMSAWPADWAELLPLVPHLGSLEDMLGSALPLELRQKFREAADQLPNLKIAVENVQEVISQFVEQSGMNELWPAVRRRNGHDGVVTLGYVGPRLDATFSPADLAEALDPGPWATRTLLNWFQLAQQLIRREDCTLLLDETVGAVVSELVSSGALTNPVSARNSGPASVGTGMLLRLRFP